MISVCMITYNHQEFIAQAIQGVLDQKGELQIELVIGDDASTDDTSKIILDYQSKYPALIKYFRHDANIGMHDNFIFTLQQCSFKYVAFCEGDDYWIDPNKLERQFKYLENNENYILCCHDVNVKFEKENLIGKLPLVNKEIEFDIEVEDLLNINIIPSLSIFFRNHKIESFPEWVKDCEGMDWTLYMLLSKFGRFKYLPFIGAVYREHEGGVSFAHKYDPVKRINVYKKRIVALNGFKKILAEKFNKRIELKKRSLSISIFNLMYANGLYEEAINFVKSNDFELINFLNVKLQLKYLNSYKKHRLKL